MGIIGSRQGGVDTQLAVLKFIPNTTAPAAEAGADQLYDAGDGVCLIDKDGYPFPLVVGADQLGVVQMSSTDTGDTFDVLTRVVLADTTDGVITGKLPLTAGIRLGHRVLIVDAKRQFSVNNFTVDGNGKNINGAATLVLSSQDGGVELVWNGTTWSVEAVPASLIGGIISLAKGGTGADLSSGTTNSTTLRLTNKVADGVSAVVAVINNTTALTSTAKLLSLENDSVEKFAVQQDGAVIAPTIGTTAATQHALPSGTDAITTNANTSRFIQGGSNEAADTLGAATKYLDVLDSAKTVAAAQKVLGVINRAGYIRNAIFNLKVAPGGTDTVVFTVQKSSDRGGTWSDTTITATIAGASVSNAAAGPSAVLASGDMLAVKMVSSAGTAAGPTAAFEVALA